MGIQDTGASNALDHINWGRIKHFSPSEWPEGVLKLMDAKIIRALSDARDECGAGYAINPSPVYGAHVRQSGSSRHSIDGGKRLSDATDFYCDWDYAPRVLMEMRRIPEIGGIGIYTDMMYSGTEGDRCMFHIDARPQRIEWVGWRESRNHPLQYVYLHSDPVEYHRILSERAGF